jgi:hypothetical protein
MRRLKGERDLERDRLVDMVETESADEAERERGLGGGVRSATGLLERRSCSLLALARANTSSATPWLW